jgi:hypothetical protein
MQVHLLLIFCYFLHHNILNYLIKVSDNIMLWQHQIRGMNP